MELLENLLRQILVIDISDNDSDLMKAYSEIDAYSQGNLHSRKLGMTARNMGKNDLWIAATAKVANAKLITTDNDFDHLNNEFISIIKY